MADNRDRHSGLSFFGQSKIFLEAWPSGLDIASELTRLRLNVRLQMNHRF